LNPGCVLCKIVRKMQEGMHPHLDPGRRESSRAQTRGVVMRRQRPAWAAWLADEGVPTLDDVDTRAVVRRIRTEGAMRCALDTAEPDELQRLAFPEPPLAGQTLAAEVGTPVPYRFGSGLRVVVPNLGCKRPRHALTG
jgi:carbamoylphosphate synthase small subunit